MASHRPVAESLSATFEKVTEAAKKAVRGGEPSAARETRSSSARALLQVEGQRQQREESPASAASYETADAEEEEGVHDDTVHEGSPGSGNEGDDDPSGDGPPEQPPGGGPPGDEPPGGGPPGDDPPGDDPPGGGPPGGSSSGESDSSDDMAVGGEAAAAGQARARGIVNPGARGSPAEEFVARELARIERLEQRLHRSLNELEVLLDPANGNKDEVPVAAANTTLAADRGDFRTEVNDAIKRLDDPANNVEREDVARLIQQLEDLAVDEVRAARQVEAQAAKWLKDLRDANERRGLKLLTPKLVTYTGSVIEWPTWSEQFTAQISSRRDLSSTDKFQFLVQHTGGEARRLIQRFKGNFDAAWRAAEGRFGQPTNIVDLTFEAMDNLKAKGTSIQDSRDLLDEFMVHVETLREMGHVFGDGIANSHPIRQMKAKLRPDCVTQWNRWVSAQGWPKDRYPTIDEFIRFMDQELKDQAAAQGKKADGSAKTSKGQGTALFQSKPAEGPKQTPTKPTRGWGGSAAAPGRGGGAGGGRKPVKRNQTTTPAAAQPKTERGPGQCAFCGQRATAHRPVDCPTGKRLTAKEKRKCLKDGCWRCLQLGHKKALCAVPSHICGIGGCQMDHHKLLHEGFDASRARPAQ